jgi:hypothetical protein
MHVVTRTPRNIPRPLNNGETDTRINRAHPSNIEADLSEPDILTASES